MGKLLAAIQFYEKDKERAMAISRLIADIERQPREDVEFCFAARFDCGHDERTNAYVGQKFKTSLFKSTRQASGWPTACNMLWADLMEWCALGNWDAVLTMEADAVPLQRDWLDKIKAEWMTAKAAGKLVAGCQITHAKYGPNFTHVNGNALWDARILKHIPEMSITPKGYPWDTYHKPKYIPYAYDSPLFVSVHNAERKFTITEEFLYRPRIGGIIPAFFHGVKSAKAEQIVRKKLSL